MPEPPDRLRARVGVVRVDVEDPARVEAGVDARDAGASVVASLLVQGVTRVLDERDLARRQEGGVVEPGDVLVAPEEERQLPGVRGRARLRELLNRTPAAGPAGAKADPLRSTQSALPA